MVVVVMIGVCVVCGEFYGMGDDVGMMIMFDVMFFDIGLGDLCGNG